MGVDGNRRQSGYFQIYLQKLLQRLKRRLRDTFWTEARTRTYGHQLCIARSQMLKWYFQSPLTPTMRNISAQSLGYHVLPSLSASSFLALQTALWDFMILSATSPCWLLNQVTTTISLMFSGRLSELQCSLPSPTMDTYISSTWAFRSPLQLTFWEIPISTQFSQAREWPLLSPSIRGREI